MQLEEANRTLTSDVANLANEKEELNNKLKATIEGDRSFIVIQRIAPFLVFLKKELHVRCLVDSFCLFFQNHRSQMIGSSRSAR